MGNQSFLLFAEITKELNQDENYSEEEFLETHRSTRNLRYNQNSPRTHGPPRNHPDRRGPTGTLVGHDGRSIPRGANYDSGMYDARRDMRNR